VDVREPREEVLGFQMHGHLLNSVINPDEKNKDELKMGKMAI